MQKQSQSNMVVRFKLMADLQKISLHDLKNEEKIGLPFILESFIPFQVILIHSVNLKDFSIFILTTSVPFPEEQIEKGLKAV